MCGQKPMTALQQLSEDSLLEDNVRFHGIAADWVTDFKAEVEQRFNKKPFSQELPLLAGRFFIVWISKVE